MYTHSAMDVSQTKHKTLQKYKSPRCKLHIFYVVLNAILEKNLLFSDSFVKTLTHDGLCETVDSNVEYHFGREKEREGSISVSRVVGGNKVHDHFFSER